MLSAFTSLKDPPVNEALQILTQKICLRLPLFFSYDFLPGPVFCAVPPFTLPFLFRFASGIASLRELLVVLPFTLTFLFQDQVFWKNADLEEIQSWYAYKCMFCMMPCMF